MHLGCSLDLSKAPTKIFLKTLRGKIDRLIEVRARLNGYGIRFIFLPSFVFIYKCIFKYFSYARAWKNAFGREREGDISVIAILK